jgi:prepilin-type N-terminal cleavage/methylation domain-containing protein
MSKKWTSSKWIALKTPGLGSCFQFIAPRGSGREGFSLIELLVVVGLISILAVAVVPALNSIRASSATASHTALLGDLLAAARSYAMSKKTFVCFALGEVSAGDGQPKLFAVTIASLTGSRIDPDQVSTYTVLRKNLFLSDQIKISQIVNNDGNLERPAGSQVLDISQAAANDPFIFLNPQLEIGIHAPGPLTADKVIEFDPKGVAKYTVSPGTQAQLFKYYEIPLKQTIGNESNVSVIHLDGISGMPTIYRP